MSTKLTTTINTESPSGFEYTGDFRPPKIGEWFLNIDSTANQSKLNYVDYWHNYRPMLRKIEPKTVSFRQVLNATVVKTGQYYRYKPDSERYQDGYTGVYRNTHLPNMKLRDEIEVWEEVAA